MKQDIWNNDVAGTYKDIFLAELPEKDNSDGEIDWDDNAIWDQAYDEVEMCRDDMLSNLDSIRTKGNVVIIGTIERWNGSIKVYKEPDKNSHSLSDAITTALSSFGGSDNSFDVYYENGSVFLSQYGHDNPVNPAVLEFRETPQGITVGDLEEAYEENNEGVSIVDYLMAHTGPLGYIAEHTYGFEKDARENDSFDDRERE